jgi:ferredoxin, 2Fe-2S
MPQITVTTREGQENLLDVPSGISAMQAIRDVGIYELLALCGGVCSCATCHVYVDESCAAALPAISPDEDDLLEGSGHRKANSRLSCQIQLSAALDGLRMTIAPED